MRAALPWLALAAAVVLATAPAWSRLLPGGEPSLEELLQVRCAGRPPTR